MVAIQNFDKIFIHYADDGVFTGKQNAPATKEELIALCHETGREWKITKMEIMNLSVNGEKAFAETTLKMVAGGSSIVIKKTINLKKEMELGLL